MISMEMNFFNRNVHWFIDAGFGGSIPHTNVSLALNVESCYNRPMNTKSNSKFV